ncbi:uncharacterized protein LOC123923551 isoform X2 [Trifolium pratense]|uniref:Uncharacterized protein n=1 Tax=Trifolium pratense TaxID=57577 RepID=A0ACB0KD53_TRIPR|nr:uncharacterized protein LOC123923551 isoform X2 [Trifolium pratense]CAJ2655237.1 unnamed protein product [Trifolium pratense]
MDKNPKPPRKFTPKIKPKPKSTKIETLVEDGQKSGDTRVRLRRLVRVAERQPKLEKQSSVQDAFPGGLSLSPRTFDSGNGKSSGSESKFSANEKNGSTHSSTAIEDQSDTSMIDVTDDTSLLHVTGDTSLLHVTDDTTDEEDYMEPWDLDSDYPITLPLRKPNSGNPAILDEVEFGEAATNVEYDGENLNSAEELGLLQDNSEQPQMIIFKLPAVLPRIEQPVSSKGKEKIGTSKVSKKGTNLLELPSGCIGKMQVYKSGAVKLKIGETLYDVSSGTKTKFAQDVVAINTEKKNYSVLGAVTVNTKAVVVPDIDAIDLLKD